MLRFEHVHDESYFGLPCTQPIGTVQVSLQLLQPCVTMTPHSSPSPLLFFTQAARVCVCVCVAGRFGLLPKALLRMPVVILDATHALWSCCALHSLVCVSSVHSLDVRDMAIAATTIALHEMWTDCRGTYCFSTKSLSIRYQQNLLSMCIYTYVLPGIITPIVLSIAFCIIEINTSVCALIRYSFAPLSFHTTLCASFPHFWNCYKLLHFYAIRINHMQTKTLL